MNPGDRVRSLTTGWGGVVLPYTGTLVPDPEWPMVRWDNGVESYGSIAFLRRETTADVAEMGREEK